MKTKMIFTKHHHHLLILLLPVILFTGRTLQNIYIALMDAFEGTYQPKTDFVKALAIFAAAATGAVAIYQSWVAANQDLAMALLFGIGYAGIIFEEFLA